MKSLLLLLLASMASAGEVRLAWDQNIDRIDGYIVHWSDVQGEHSQTAVSAVATVGGLVHGRRYDFWITAILDGIESMPSNHIDGVFISATLEQSDDLLKWQSVYTRGDLVEVPRRFYRVRMGDL